MRRGKRELDNHTGKEEKGPILLVASTGNAYHCPARKDFQHVEESSVEQASLIHSRDVRRDTIAVLVSAIEAHEPFIYGHPRRVAYLAQAIGRALGWGEEGVATIEIGAFLHDLGKIVISDAVLQKPGPLTAEEYNEVKRHPEAGARLLIAGGLSLEMAIPYVLYHHEHYDGRGYPYGLAGENIPSEGRILAVADAFEAMISDRPYRARMKPELALEIIEKSAGSQFDPKVVAAFLRTWETGQIQALLEGPSSSKQRPGIKVVMRAMRAAYRAKAISADAGTLVLEDVRLNNCGG